jgi:hypothetical protein
MLLEFSTTDAWVEGYGMALEVQSIERVTCEVWGDGTLPIGLQWRRQACRGTLCDDLH